MTRITGRGFFSSMRAKRWLVAAGTFMFCLLIFVVSTNAQDLPADVTAPPPLRVIPAAEKSQLNSITDPKARARLSIELAHGHLARAEQFTAASDFDNASTELGYYRAIIEDALKTIGVSGDKGNKTRD